MSSLWLLNPYKSLTFPRNVILTHSICAHWTQQVPFLLATSSCSSCFFIWPSAEAQVRPSLIGVSTCWMSPVSSFCPRLNHHHSPLLSFIFSGPLADLPACTPVLREVLCTQRIVQPLDLPGASFPSEDQFCSPGCGPVVRPAPLVLVSLSPLRALRFRLRARCSLGAMHGSVARLL